MNQNRRLERLERAFEKLLAKTKAYIVFHPKVETEEEAIQAAINAGVFDPDTHEPVFIISHIPRKGYQLMSSTGLPARDLRREEMHQLAEDASRAIRFEGTHPTEPPPEKPQKRMPIDYPREFSPV